MQSYPEQDGADCQKCLYYHFDGIVVKRKGGTILHNKHSSNAIYSLNKISTYTVPNLPKHTTELVLTLIIVSTNSVLCHTIQFNGFTPVSFYCSKDIWH